MRLGIDILVDRAAGCLDTRLVDRLLQLLTSRLHQRAVECTTNLERNGTLGSRLLGLLHCLIDSIDGAADDYLPGAVVIGWDDQLVEDIGADLLHLGVG